MSDEQTQRTAADVVQALPVPPTPEAIEQSEEAITQPAKLLRIASMVRELLEQTRQTTLDEPGRKRLADIYGRAVGELSEVLSPDLREELGALAPPMEAVPTEAELRVAQAQFQELQRRGLLAQNPQPSDGEDGAQQDPRRSGQYL